tara:strand:- start:268 stop:1254 length:987 start_codon:yes stop_codon:yes gene_type:complete
MQYKLDLSETVQTRGYNPTGETKKFVFPVGRFPLKKKIAISFSGGKTSAYMTKMLMDRFRDDPEYEVVVTFANTGEEHEETLKFVDRCDKAFDLDVVWLEAEVIPEKGVGTTFRVVDFESASRDGRPFEDVIKKYGIPNKSYNHCTRETKLAPLQKFVNSTGWHKGDVSWAVGIRYDEMDRVSLTSMVTRNVFYPCVDAQVTNKDVIDFWAEQSFNLNIPSHLGNCKWCWKKSKRKLLTLFVDHPEFFDFPLRMEREYALVAGKRRDGGEEVRKRTFFRENKSGLDLLELSKLPFEPFSDHNYVEFDSDMDVGGSCGESCEVFSDLPN